MWLEAKSLKTFNKAASKAPVPQHHPWVNLCRDDAEVVCAIERGSVGSHSVTSFFPSKLSLLMLNPSSRIQAFSCCSLVYCTLFYDVVFFSFSDARLLYVSLHSATFRLISKLSLRFLFLTWVAASCCALFSTRFSGKFESSFFSI